MGWLKQMKLENQSGVAGVIIKLRYVELGLFLGLGALMFSTSISRRYSESKWEVTAKKWEAAAKAYQEVAERNERSAIEAQRLLRLMIAQREQMNKRIYGETQH